MQIHSKSQWNERQIIEFLESSDYPIRLSFLDSNQEPLICSLWFNYKNGAIWAASHESAYLISQLKNNSKISFEVSSNQYPYKGVRGKAVAVLSKVNADTVLAELISKYLGDSNTQLSSWLMSRVDGEYAIKIVPSSINAWDFSNRMEQ